MEKNIYNEKEKKLNHALRTQISNLKGVMVLKNNDLVYQYLDGKTKIDTPCNVASVTKSVMSALVGIAIDKGFIGSVKDKVLSYFPEYVPDTNKLSLSEQMKWEMNQLVTIEHILTMTAPFAFSLKNLESRPMEPLDRIRRQKDWTGYILGMMGDDTPLGVDTKALEGTASEDLSASTEPSWAFQYTTAGPHLLSAIIKKTTGMSTLEFANKFLFGPIGMRTIEDKPMPSFSIDHVFAKKVTGWIKDPSDVHAGGFGLTLTLEDMLKLGQLYLNKGIHNGEQIISSEWVEATIQPHTSEYGYLWWLHKEQNIETYAAMGFGGNMICVIPELQVVIAAVAELKYTKQSPWTLLDDHLLPYLQELP